MADKNEIVEKLIEGVPEGIKEIVAELQTLKSIFDSSQKSISDYLNKAVEGFEKMKKARCISYVKDTISKAIHNKLVLAYCSYKSSHFIFNKLLS